ncbi:DNA methyltransferase [Candidatus Pacearchaeota archaeon]|nr:DNA methyltransferase [Candidatus Pacearchaeota archaeon]
MKIPNKKYKIIYADPPWAYNESGSGNRVVNSKYKTLQIEEIEKIPVKDISDDNCILFLWVTFPRLKEGIRLIESWGFNYHSLGFNWIKTNKEKRISFFWGMGYYTRQNSEVCLIGIKGKIKPKTNNIHSIVKSKVRNHSQKPDIIRELIIKICGDLPRIELFAREKIEGWDAFGNEVPTSEQKRIIPISQLHGKHNL